MQLSGSSSAPLGALAGWRAAVLVGLFVVAPIAHGKSFEIDFKLKGGNVAEEFDALGSLYTWFVSSHAEGDLIGDVTVETVKLDARGSFNRTNYAYFDVELYFTSAMPPAPFAPYFQCTRCAPSFSPRLGAPTYVKAVLSSEHGGLEDYSVLYSFRDEAGILLPGGEPGPGGRTFYEVRKDPFKTNTTGLVTTVFAWTGAESNLALNSIHELEMKVTGKIVNYQIRPNPNSGTITVEPKDNAYNAEVFTNSGTIDVQDVLTNRNQLHNHGSIAINGKMVDGAVNDGRLINSGSLSNHGAITLGEGLSTPSGQAISNTGYFAIENGGTLTLGSYSGGLENSGLFLIQHGGRVTDRAGIVNTNTFIVNATEGAGEGELVIVCCGEDSFGSFSNSGRLEVRGKIDSTTVGSVFSNSGTILVSGTLKDAGHFNNSGQIEISHTGTFEEDFEFQNFDTGHIVNDGTLLGYGVTTNQGTVANRAVLKIGSAWTDSGTLENTGVFLTIEAGGHLKILNSGTNSTLIENNGTLDVGGTLVNGGVIDNYNEMNVSGTIVRDAQGAGLTDAVVKNQAQLHVGTTGFVRAERFEQIAGTAKIDGIVSADQNLVTGGVVRGSGRLVGDTVVTGGAVILPGSSPGTLTFDGDLTLDGAEIEFELGAGDAHDRIVVNGNLVVHSALARFALAADADPDLDHRVDFITASSGPVPAIVGDTPQPNVLVLVPTIGTSGWRVQPLGIGGMTVAYDYDAAYQIPVITAGTRHRVEIDAFGYNREPSLPGEGVLEVAGHFTNRRTSPLSISNDTRLDTGGLDVLAGARVSNRSYWFNLGALTQAGTFSNREDAQFYTVGQLVNTGTILNEGEFLHIGAEFANVGILHNRDGGNFSTVAALANDGTIDNAGALYASDGGVNSEAGVIVNAAGGVLTNFQQRTLVNRGTLDTAGRVENDGVFQNRGTVRVRSGGRFDGSDIDLDPALILTREYVQFDGETVIETGGVLAQRRMAFHGGRLEGEGTLIGATDLHGVVVEIGGDAGAAGTLTFDGVSEWIGPLLEFDIGSASIYDRIIGGALHGTASLNLVFDTPFDLARGELLALITLGEGSTLDINSLLVQSYFRLGEDLIPWSPLVDGELAQLRRSGNVIGFGIAPIPIPPAWPLMAGVGLWLLRRRAAA